MIPTDRFFLTELSASDSEYTPFSNNSTGDTEINHRVFDYINELIDNDDIEDHDEPPKTPFSNRKEAEEDRLQDLLVELNDMSQWSHQKEYRYNLQNNPTNSSTHLRIHTGTIPSLLINLTLQDWRVVEPRAVAIEYSLFMWSVGQLEQTIQTFGVRAIDGEEETKRGDLICTFRTALEKLLAATAKHAAPHYTTQYRQNSPSERRSLTVEDISLTMESPGSARKWYFLNKCKSNSTLLMSKSLAFLSTTVSKIKPNSETKVDEPVQRRVTRSTKESVEAALRLGEALGELVVYFMRTSCKLDDHFGNTSAISFS